MKYINVNINYFFIIIKNYISFIIGFSDHQQTDHHQLTTGAVEYLVYTIIKFMT